MIRKGESEREQHFMCIVLYVYEFMCNPCIYQFFIVKITPWFPPNGWRYWSSIGFHCGAASAGFGELDRNTMETCEPWAFAPRFLVIC